MSLPPPPLVKSPSTPLAGRPKPPIVLPPAAPNRPSPVSRHTPKTFSVSPWQGGAEGEKIMLYANNGMGKSTLASLAPNPIFIGLDDGARKLENPKTGQRVNHIPGIASFQDIRDALQQHSLFPAGSTLVFDTITEVDQYAIKHTCATVKTDKGQAAENLEEYGYGKGYVHQNDTMRLLLGDLEPLVRNGVNVLFLAQQGQATVANLEGTDYVQDGPLLTAQPKAGANVRATICGWCDHIFRISYPPVEVVKANAKATKGKASGTTERVIYAEPEVYFVAKNRMNGKLPPVVAFASRDDDSLWQFIFGGK